MKLILDLPEEVVKKIKAMAILSGGIAGIEEQVISLIDETVSQKIAAAIGVTASPISRPAEPIAVKVFQPTDEASDVTGISDGLGDEDDSDEGEPEEGAVFDLEAFVPDAKTSHTLTDEILSEDLAFDEGAAAGAKDSFVGEISQDAESEQVFATTAGLPIPAPSVIEETAHMQRRRKHAVRGKAVISGYGG